MSAILMGVSAGASVIGSFSGRSKSKRAAKKQKELDLANLRLMRMELDESLRREDVKNKSIEATQRNVVGASGFSGGGSLSQYMDYTKETHKKNVDWMKMAGESRIAIGAREASARKSMSDSMADANFFSGMASAVGAGAMAGGMYEKGGVDDKLFGWMFK